jgi:hypothetical protein
LVENGAGEQVLLVVEARREELGIFVGQENVVDMDEDARRQHGQNFEEEAGGVGAVEGQVAAVEKEDVAGAQSRETLDVHVQQVGLHHLVGYALDVGAGRRVDGGDGAVEAVVVDGLAEEPRAVAAADLDNAGP